MLQSPHTFQISQACSEEENRSKEEEEEEDHSEESKSKAWRKQIGRIECFGEAQTLCSCEAPRESPSDSS